MKETKLTALASRILALTTSNRKLQLGLARHEVANRSIEIKERKAGLLLEESHKLEARLQEMARRILLVNEEGRKKMSLSLQDDILQTLEGIHLRLLVLSKEVTAGSEDFEKEIAITQGLLQQSVEVINRFSRECGIDHEN